MRASRLWRAIRRTTADMLASGWKNRHYQVPRRQGESASAYRDRIYRLSLQEQLVENQEWWQRLGCALDFAGARVLDFGCGLGALSVDLARQGAREVVGLDLNDDLLDFARENLQSNHRDLANVVRFANQDVTNMAEQATFDVIVSKDVLEHVGEPQAVFASFARLLKPGGALVLGFSPLYYSPFGDHMRLGLPVPWLHAFLPDRIAIAWSNRIQRRRITRIAELELNQLTPAAFRSLIDADLWRIEFIKYNRGNKRFMNLFRVARKIAFAEPYFTISIYALLRRSDSGRSAGPALSR